MNRFDIIKQFRHRYKNKHTGGIAEIIDKIYDNGKLTHYVLQNLKESKPWPSWKEALKRKMNVTPEELREHWIELTNYE